VTVSGVVLSTPDPAGAAGFYGELLGWRRAGDVLTGADDVPVAALAPDGAAPGWGVVLAGTAERASAAGGEVLDGEVVRDPAGALFGSAAPAVPLPPPGAGRPAWFENMTTDAPAADRFYAAVTGWTVQPAGPGYALFVDGGRPVAGRLELPPDLAAALGPRWMVYLAHADVDAAAAAVPGLGGAVVVPPRDTPTGRLVAVTDPAGAVITLLRPA
jgi:uncharacterized protein